MTDETSVAEGSYTRIYERYQSHGQQHVFQFYNTLSESEQASFLNQLDSIPVENLATWMHNATNEESNEVKKGNIQPFKGKVAEGSVLAQDTSPSSAWDVGLQAIANSEVAAVTLAGGQGTRLGYNGPKGMFVLPQMNGDKSLFQLFAERLLKLKELAASATSKNMSDIHLPWYIMTSPINDQITREFFAKHNDFDLDVIFFEQSMLPCLDMTGKIILESKGRVSMAPNGNGGIWTQLAHNNAKLAHDMKSIGIKYMHVFSVDNALARPADPLFIGYCINESADCGNKVLWKSHALEKVGVIAEIDGNPHIIEYSDMSEDMCAMVNDETGKLVFGAGNICNHFFDFQFVMDKIISDSSIEYHIAKKKIPYVDHTTGEIVKPSIKNGIKLETFIFDVFPLSQRMAIINVNRDEEFAPVKNANGDGVEDTPDIARRMISSLAKKQIMRAGFVLKGDLDSDLCEISPLTSYCGEGLYELKKDNRELHSPFCI